MTIDDIITQIYDTKLQHEDFGKWEVLIEVGSEKVDYVFYDNDSNDTTAKNAYQFIIDYKNKKFIIC